MTHLHRLDEHTEQFDYFVDEHIDDPEDWVVLIGGAASSYNITAPESGSDDLFKIGTSGFAGDAFADDMDTVWEAHNGDEISTAFLHTLLVHRDQLSDEIVDDLFDDAEQEVEA